jgi:hypothetical protein
VAWINKNYVEKHPGISELTARISSYELAFRMQGCAPEAVNLDSESEETKRLYGLDNKVSEPFGRQCLMARRLIERGVRAVQLWNGAVVNQNVDTWDAHNSIVDNHGRHAPEVDKPIAGLITDASLTKGRGARPQSGSVDGVDGGRWNQRWPIDWGDR